jgi:hypothetical protein
MNAETQSLYRSAIAQDAALSFKFLLLDGQPGEKPAGSGYQGACMKSACMRAQRKQCASNYL